MLLGSALALSPTAVTSARQPHCLCPLTHEMQATTAPITPRSVWAERVSQQAEHMTASGLDLTAVSANS